MISIEPAALTMDDVRAFNPAVDGREDLEILLELLDQNRDLVLLCDGVYVNGVLGLVFGVIEMEWGHEVFTISSHAMRSYPKLMVRLALGYLNGWQTENPVVFAHCADETWAKWLALLGFEFDTFVSSLNGRVVRRYRREKTWESP